MWHAGPDVVFQTDLKTTSSGGNDVLLLGLWTTKILSTKPWHKQAVGDSAWEICRAAVVVNSCAASYSPFSAAFSFFLFLQRVQWLFLALRVFYTMNQNCCATRGNSRLLMATKSFQKWLKSAALFPCEFSFTHSVSYRKRKNAVEAIRDHMGCLVTFCVIKKNRQEVWVVLILF